MFAWTESELDPEQAKAVLEPGSLFLVACPGSGKTRTLTYKIALELSKISSIREFAVAITYTNRAADEIRERIEGLGVDTSQLWIGTIHSFCLEWILKPYGLYEAELENGFRVIDSHEREVLLETLCKPYSSSRITHWDCDYYFEKEGYVLGCPDAGKHASVKKILQAYFIELKKNRQIDFELILWHAFQILTKNTSICGLLSKLFQIILVDEYQDTKEIQYEIVAAILRAGQGSTRLFMVGDPNQAIYGSLGGYAIELDQLKAITGIEIEDAALSQNYRSSSRLVSYFGNFNVYKTEIEAAGKDQDYQSLITYDHSTGVEALADEIAGLVRYSAETLGIPPRQICVLAPQWMHLATMTRKLVTRMPGYDFDGPGMAPFARDIENFWYKLARVALTEPSPSMYVRRLRWAGEILRDLNDVGAKADLFSKKEFLRECNSISIHTQDGIGYLRTFFDELFQRLKIDFQKFTQLREHHEAFFESSGTRIQRLEKEGVDGVGGIEFFRKVFKERAGVTVSTIHGVKGAEFDVVIAYALLDGMVPHFNDQDGKVSAQKLLYVVGSRARKNLHLFSESGRPRGRYKTYSATPCLIACKFGYDSITK